MSTALEKIQQRQASKKSDQAAIINEGSSTSFFKVKRAANGGNVYDVVILQAGFVALLRHLGFRKYDVGEGFIVIRIVDNIIEQFQHHQLRGFIVRYFHNMDESELSILECPKDLLIEKLHRSLGTLTTDEKLSLLFDLDGKEEITIVEDTMDTAFFFYQNGYVTVTKEGITLNDYTSLPGCVWKDQILKRNFSPMPMKEWEKGAYHAFANNVADNFKAEDGTESNPARFVSFMTLTGYCLHKFFNTKLKMPIFLDARESEFPDGRSGKSLHCKALGHMMNADLENGKQCIISDGKSFDPENRFKYEDLHVSTRLFVLDDAKRNFPIELLYNAIVDGFMRERKGEKEKVRIRCKPIVTLNYTLQIQGGSALDRVIEFEFADFYSVDKTPEMVHGMWFFRDWDDVEWCRFDNFMLSCVSDYLKAGVVAPKTINLEARKLRDETAQEFIDWMEDLAIEHEKDYNKSDLFKKFGVVNDDGRVTKSGFNWLKQRDFTKWLKLWVQYRPEMAGYRESRSSGESFIQFFYNAPVRASNLESVAKNTRVVLFKDKCSGVVAVPEVEASQPEIIMNPTKINEEDNPF